MDAGFFDKESWKRSIGPAVRVFAYIAMLFVFVYIIVLVLNYLLLLITGDSTIASTVSGYFSSVLFVFSAVIAFFKVLDEQKPGNVQLEVL